MPHTPGPWKVVDIYEVQAGKLRFRQNYEPGETDNGDLESAKENALLISSAPDLLKMCKKSLEVIEDVFYQERYDFGYMGFSEKLKNAIAKAEGR